ncbi:MAG TPA: DUF4215 domain-containing protein, partial [bacterium]|nr:DUF4215 domain-containing protein [bacterium]
GVIQSSHEVCDPGSLFFTEYAIRESESCTSSCVIGRYCGNSSTDSSDGELCDDGAGNKPFGVATGYLADCIDANGGPGKACKYAHYCGDAKIDGPGGDGYLGGWEVCDDGPGGNVGEYSKCNSGCASKAPYCGDGIRQRANCSGFTPCTVYPGSNENCDNGASNTTAPGTYTGTCRPGCTYAKCGDGVIDTAMGEECDDGVANNDFAPLACRTTCRMPKCGDGILDPGEQCDDSNLDNFDSCTDMCKHAKCSDGIQKTTDSTVGSFIFVTNEACDDGNTISGDYCRNDCLAVTGFCGDGVKQTNEACDKATTGVGIGAYCSNDCKNILGRCGDGVVQVFASEVCDHNDQPNGNYCAPNCKSQYGAYGSCGDGIIQANEVCDKAAFGAGIGAYCSNDCKANLGSCGDLVIQRNSCSGYTVCTALITTNCCKVVAGASELCDDGANNGAYKAVTNVNDAYCNTNCAGRGAGGFCGDNNTNSPHENCDDGGNNGLYSTSYPGFCSANCQVVGGAGYCGNSTKEGPEQCDVSAGVVACNTGTAPNGNPYYTGTNTACLGTCVYDYSVCKYCGDGLIQSAKGETCDGYLLRENRNDWGALQACRTNCTGWAPFCGDAILHRQDCVGGVWLDPSTGTNRACVQSNGAWETCEAGTFGGALPGGCVSCSKFIPSGNFEVSTDGNSASTSVPANIEGWACDRDTPNQNIQITINFYNKNGTKFHSKAMFTHKAREAAVQSACLSSISTHGFTYNPKIEANYSTLFNSANRAFRVEVVAHDTTPGAGTATLGVGCAQQYSGTQCYYGGYCGDSSTQSWYGEGCDPSTESSKCTYGQTSCSRCSNACQNYTSYNLTGYCGDGIRQATWETCDTQTESRACSCTYCSSSDKNGCTGYTTKNGTETRSCNGTCGWNSWSSCSVSC